MTTFSCPTCQTRLIARTRTTINLAPPSGQPELPASGPLAEATQAVAEWLRSVRPGWYPSADLYAQYHSHPHRPVLQAPVLGRILATLGHQPHRTKHARSWYIHPDQAHEADQRRDSQLFGSLRDPQATEAEPGATRAPDAPTQAN